MKCFKNIIHIVTITTILSLIVTILPVSPVLAASEDITLDPDEGEIGERIGIEGEDFDESWDIAPDNYYDSEIDIYFSSQEADEGDEIDNEVENYEEVKSGLNVDENGQFDTSFYVPAKLTDGEDDEVVYSGTYYIYVTYKNDTDIVAIAEFMVIAAEIELSPDEGSVSTEVEITGINFTESETIAIEFDDDDLDIESGDDETDSSGEFECTVIIPEVTAGEHTITVTDDSDMLAEVYFTVEPEIIVSTDRTALGDSITINGTGFGKELDYIVYLDGDEVFDDETDEYGSFAADFIVSVLNSGTYDVETLDDDDNSAEAVFSIDKFVININPSNGYAGTEVAVSGIGFMPNNSVSINFNNDYVTNSLTDLSGSLGASFIVPDLTAGNYLVKVSDGANTEEFTFTINQAASIGSESGYVGEELNLNGNRFTAGRTVTISYDAVQVATTGVNHDGTFSAAFSIPASVRGVHTIIITDGINTEQFTYSMESTPPSAVYPQLPFIGGKLKGGRFDWCGDAADLNKEVTDQSLPVTYTLQIASSQDFSEDSIQLEKTGLIESEYILAEEEQLESASKDTPYYWRVKAIDGASNDTEWTDFGTFYVGFTFDGLPRWALYTLIGFTGILIGYLIGNWRGKRAFYYP
ncbi:IPT/TIG domain-containing protein [Chloroflexota bacterium]